MLARMGRKPLLPSELLSGPFTIVDARRAGLDRWNLEGASWRRIAPQTYVWKGLAEDPMHRIEGARRRLPAVAAFSGLTAAWLHGLDVRPCDPIEVTIPQDVGVSGRAGIAVRRSTVGKHEVVEVRGMPATSIVRTLADLCGRLSTTEAVVIADAALHVGKVRVNQLSSWANSKAGWRGIENFRRMVGFAEPAAESPMESRLRMLLVLAGLPRPKAQVSIHDRWGRFVGRPDLYYDEYRLGIEYDGGTHRDALAQDNRRQNKLLNAGVRLLRFTAGDVIGNPDFVVAQVRALLENWPSNPASAGRRG